MESPRAGWADMSTNSTNFSELSQPRFELTFFRWEDRSLLKTPQFLACILSFTQVMDPWRARLSV